MAINLYIHILHPNHHDLIHRIYRGILPGQNARMNSDVFCMCHSACYGHLCSTTIHVASRQA